MSLRSTLVGALTASLVGATFAAVPLLTAPPARADVTYQVPWTPDGQVNAIAIGNGDTQYLGGSFTSVDLRAQGLAVVNSDPAAGGDWHAVDRTFPTVDGTVNAVVSDGAGGWFVGGDFHQIGSPAVAIDHLAHVRPDGQTDPSDMWNAYVTGAVHALSLVDGVLYVGGAFTSPGAAVIAVDPLTGVTLATFGLGSGSVRSLAVSASGVGLDGAVVYAGGTFNDGVDHHLAAFVCDAANAVCNLDANWTEPQLTGDVLALAFAGPGDFLYLGGDFTTVDGDPDLGSLARLDATTGTVDTTWTPSPDNVTSAVDLDSGVLYAAGSFVTVGIANGGGGAQTRMHLAAFDTSDPTGAPTSWDPNADDVVSSLDASGGSVFVGGQFSTIGSDARTRFAQIDAASGAASSLSLEPDNSITALAVDANGKVAMGGSFTRLASLGRMHAASLDSTGALTDWRPIVHGGNVEAIAVAPGGILLGGGFDWVSDPTAANAHLAYVDSYSGNANAFPVTVNGTVRALSVRSTSVYLGGDFTIVGDANGAQTRQRLARITYSGTWGLDDWTANLADGQVRALMWLSRTLYVGGSFAYYVGPDSGLQEQRNAAAFDLTTGALIPAWNPAPNGPVNALAYTSYTGTVFLGGEFTTLAGAVARPYAGAVASADAWTGSAIGNVRAWNPQPDGIVRALQVYGPGPNSNVVIGGDFTHLMTRARAGLGAVTAGGMGGTRSWKPLVDQPSSVVRAIVIGNAIDVGGTFTSAAPPSARNFDGLSFPRSEPGPMEYWFTDFGVVRAGSVVMQTVVAVNRSGMVVMPNEVTVTGPGVTYLGGCNLGMPISANATCAINLMWAPGSAGQLANATLSMRFIGTPADSDPAPVALTGLAADPAAAPTGLAATPADGSAEIAFTPGSDGGSAITNYQYALDGGEWNAVSPDDASSPVAIPGLTNGTEYSIAIRAVTGLGAGAASEPVSVTPRTAASAPTGLIATPGDGSAEIAFTAGLDGGTPITNYEYALDGGDWTALSPDDATSPVTIVGLTNDVTYSLALRAVTAAGPGATSATVDVTPSVPLPSLSPTSQTASGTVGVPMTPTAAIDAANFSHEPTFTIAPALPEGLVIDSATGQVSGTPRAASASRSYTITAAMQTESATSTLQLGVAASSPGAPTAVKAVAGDGRATVSWRAPAATGGAALTEYEVTSSPGGKTCRAIAPSRTCIVTGLRNGSAYTFTVRAYNGTQWSPASAASASVTPKPRSTIVITGSRTANGATVIITGVTKGLEGKSVTPWTRSRIHGKATALPAIRVAANGKFTWKWNNRRWTSVYFTSGSVRSNEVVVPL